MLDSKQCDAFMAVAEHGSFDLAGDTLCITPSAVTLRVQALEKQLGQLLLIRARPCTLTPAGQQLFEHLQHTRRLEQNLMHTLAGPQKASFFQAVIATNADSLSTWLLPALHAVLIQEKILLQLRVDDQSHTYSWLQKGIVSGCISVESNPMKGCQAQYLGKMKYQLVATQAFTQQWFAHGINRTQLRSAPAIIFNEKDHIHFSVLESQFGLPQGSYPCHVIPSSESYFTAVQLGMGYGIVPEFQVKAAQQPLINLMPNYSIEIPLYWHHWSQQSQPLQRLTEHMLHHARHFLV